MRWKIRIFPRCQRYIEYSYLRASAEKRDARDCLPLGMQKFEAELVEKREEKFRFAGKILPE